MKMVNFEKYKKTAPIIILLLLSISIVSATQPSQKVLIQDVSIDFMSEISFPMHVYFDDYDTIVVSFTDPVINAQRNLQARKGMNDDSYNPSYMDVELWSFSNTIYLYIQSYEENVGPFDITVYAYDWDTLNEVSDVFEFEIEGSYSPGSAPVQVASFPTPLVLTGDDSEFYLLNNYFNDYTTAEYSFYDPIGETNVELVVSKGGSTVSSYVTSNIEVYLIPYSNNIGLEIVSKDIALGPETTTVTATNTFGSTNTNFVLETEAVVPPTPGFEPDNLLDGLVSYYKLDETSGTAVNNEVGTNGVATNSRIFTSNTGTSGIINSGADFTQGDDQIATDIIRAVQSPFTWNVWVNKPTSEGLRMIMNQRIAGPWNGIGFDGNNIYWRVQGGTSVTSDNITLNEWVMLTLTFDGTDGKRYIDGVYIGDVSKGTVTGSDEIFIGSREGSLYYTGLADEVGVWDRALESNEVSDLYNNGDGLSYDTFEGGVADPMPSQIASFPTTLSYEYLSSDSLSMNQFFQDYDDITVSFTDPITSAVESITRSKGEVSQEIVRTQEGNLVYDMSLNPTSTNIVWSIETGSIDFETLDLTFTATNTEGNIVSDPVTVTITEEAGDAPLLVLSPSDLYYNPDGNVRINFKDYFLQPTYNDMRAEITVGFTQFSIDEAGSTDIGISLLTLNKGQGGFLFFEENNEGIVNIRLFAINDFGETDTLEFQLVFDPTIKSSVIESFVDSFINLFPSSETRSLSQKLGTVFIVMLLVSIITGYGMSGAGGISQAGIYIILLLNFGLFIFFTGIGYISVWIIIMIVLLTIAYLMLPFIKGGG